MILRGRRLALLLALALPTVVTTEGLARADGPSKAECLTASAEWANLLQAHKLRAARAQLLVCAAESCPTDIREECFRHIPEVTAAIPTIVFSVKDASGNDATEVTVSMDEQPLLTSLDGTAVPIDPGLHTFRFEMAGQAPVEKRLVLQEGETGRRQQIEFGSGAPIKQVAAAAPPSTTVLPPKTEPAISHPVQVVAGLASDTGGSSGPWKTVGWVLGGAGVVGLGLGTAFGISALEDKNANCTGNACNTGTSGGIRSRALVSDVGWIAGGVLLASGAGFVLFAPSGRPEPSASVRLSPMVIASGGEIVAAGIW
jgi:hypothetical protein